MSEQIVSSEGNAEKPPTRRGESLRALTPEQRRQFASKGGKTAQAGGLAHRWTPAEAREAAREGGRRLAAKPGRMAEMGRKGGQARAANAARAKEGQIRREAESRSEGMVSCWLVVWMLDGRGIGKELCHVPVPPRPGLEGRVVARRRDTSYLRAAEYIRENLITPTVRALPWMEPGQERS